MFKTVPEFENIVLKSNLDGSSVKIKDVARVEIGAQSYSNVTALNGFPASGISIQLSSGANAVATSNRVKEFLSKTQNLLPNGYKIAYPRDTTALYKSFNKWGCKDFAWSNYFSNFSNVFVFKEF